MPIAKTLSRITKLILPTILLLVLSSTPARAACDAGEIPTGLGCIPTDPTKLVLKILEIAVGVAGGVALLSVLFGGLKVLTSSGDPDGIKEGKGMITNAIAGLVLILFSVAILNIIGFNVLGIPFFNTGP